MTRTTREALIAEMLGDLDILLNRTEKLPVQLAAITHALNDATDRYRTTVSEFTQSAKTELTEHVSRATAEASNEYSAQLRAIVRDTLNREINTPAIQLAEVLVAATNEFHQARQARLLESMAIAVCSGLIASLTTWLLMR